VRARFVFLQFFFFLVLLELALRLGGFLMLRRWAAPAATTATAGALRILAIGESTTYGLGVDRDKAYPALLERMLQERSGTKVVVFNTGVPGQTSTSIVRSVDYQLHKYRPDIVISMFGVNDTNEALNDVSSRLLFGFYVPDAVAHLRVFKLATIVRDYALSGTILKEDGAWSFFDPAQQAPKGVWRPNLYYRRQVELNYGDVIDIIRAYGARLVMTSYMRADPRLRQLLERIARDKDVPYLELYSRETDRDEYFNDDRFHPNERGHEVIATKLADLLEKDGLLAVRGP